MTTVRTVTRLWCETCGDLDPGRSKPERVLDSHAEQHRHVVHLTTSPARCQHLSPSPWGTAQCVLADGHDGRHAYSPSEADVLHPPQGAPR